MKPDETFLLQHTQSMLPIAGSWSPVLLVAFAHDRLALALSMIVAILAIVDYLLKIAWKIRQSLLAKDLPPDDGEAWVGGMQRHHRKITEKPETHESEPNN